MRIPQQRERVGGGSIMQDILIMAEGNPGATVALGAILNAEGEMGYIDILNLDDMNIRGAQIWICYKDFCKADVKKFIELCRKRDLEMVNFVNNHRGHEGHKAVTSGASFLEGNRPVLPTMESI